MFSVFSSSHFSESRDASVGYERGLRAWVLRMDVKHDLRMSARWNNQTPPPAATIDNGGSRSEADVPLPFVVAAATVSGDLSWSFEGLLARVLV
mmetsp:Transcript_17657/g.49010  ORF Transcript_17657/g.49010 Transcript_17657/m.49010 type:complete len:94 (+) Transcript_17657:307-588(+)